MPRLMGWIPLLLTLVCSIPVAQGAGLETPALPEKNKIPVEIEYQITNTYPHDHNASTQGLVYQDGLLYESTGMFGKSSLRKVRLGDAHILQKTRLLRTEFAEGLTLFKNKLYQLTWRSGIGSVYSSNDLKLLKNFYYQGEGWGLTHNSNMLIMSDGSAKLHFIDGKTLKKTQQIEVTDQYGPVMRLNELEFINGSLYANILYENQIARIDPESGNVTGWLDLQPLVDEHAPANNPAKRSSALNGIAWDSENQRMLVTGKNWPKVIELELSPADEQL